MREETVETKSVKSDNSGVDKARIYTPEFRVSFPHLFKPSGMPNTDPSTHKYSITMLFKKDADLSALTRAMKQAKINKWGTDKSKWPKKIEKPFVDGDSEEHADKKGYAGHWAVKATSNLDQKPGVVDEHKRLITDPAKLYPGCYAVAYLLARVWNFPVNSKKFGVQFIVDGVMKTDDGKAFGGKKPIDQIFGPADDGSTDDDEDDDDDELGSSSSDDDDDDDDDI